MAFLRFSASGKAVLISLLVVLLSLCMPGVLSFRPSSFGPRTLQHASRLLTTMASEIKVIKASDPKNAELVDKWNCKRWSTWGCGVSKFPWTYSDAETALIITGKVTVTPKGQEQGVLIEAGDLVTFPEGMSCTWDVHEKLEKHYSFG